MPVIPALGKYRQNNQEFKVVLGYIVSLKPAWDSDDPVSDKQTN